MARRWHATGRSPGIWHERNPQGEGEGKGDKEFTYAHDAEGEEIGDHPPGDTLDAQIESVMVRADSAGCPTTAEGAREFICHFGAMGWRDRNGNPIRDWWLKFQNYNPGAFRHQNGSTPPNEEMEARII